MLLSSMNLSYYLLCLTYILNLVLASSGHSITYAIGYDSAVGSVDLMDEFALIKQKVLEGYDDPQLIANLFNGLFVDHCIMIQEVLITMLEMGCTSSFEYLFPRLSRKNQGFILDLLNVALREHRPDMCHFLLSCGYQNAYHVLSGPHYGAPLLRFWDISPFQWTEAELEELLEGYPHLANSICPPPARLFPQNEDDWHDWSPETTLMAFRLRFRFVCDKDSDSEWDEDSDSDEEEDNDPKAEMLEAALASPYLEDDVMARVIRFLVEERVIVTMEMRDQFVQSHPDHTLSKLVLGEALAAFSISQHLIQLINQDDDPKAMAEFLRIHPICFSSNLKDILHCTVRNGRFGCLQYLLGIVPDFFSGPQYDDLMTGLFMQSIKGHQVEICHLLLSHGFHYTREPGLEGHLDSLDDLTAFWAEKPFPWTEPELMGVLEHAPQLAHHFCEELGRWITSADATALLIKVNLRYGANARKRTVFSNDLHDPTAMLRDLLRKDNLHEDMVQLVELLFELGAEATEDMKAIYMHSWQSRHRGVSEAVLKALDDELTRPDCKGPEEWLD